MTIFEKKSSYSPIFGMKIMHSTTVKLILESLILQVPDMQTCELEGACVLPGTVICVTNLFIHLYDACLC